LVGVQTPEVAVNDRVTWSAKLSLRVFAYDIERNFFVLEDRQHFGEILAEVLRDVYVDLHEPEEFVILDRLENSSEGEGAPVVFEHPTRHFLPDTP